MVGDDDFDASVWWLAESDGELVGCALHWGSGWVKDIAVRESHRRRGLGEALLRQGFAEFARRGVTHVGLKVDAANPTSAIRLYERVGFVVEQ
jgi:ribosomal protein S18 acetylase RimI-like enzyme